MDIPVYTKKELRLLYKAIKTFYLGSLNYKEFCDYGTFSENINLCWRKEVFLLKYDGLPLYVGRSLNGNKPLERQRWVNAVVLWRLEIGK